LAIFTVPSDCRKADLALRRLERIPFVPLDNAFGQLLYAETDVSPDMVMADGELLGNRRRRSSSPRERNARTGGANL
jgi:hypothetical protein